MASLAAAEEAIELADSYGVAGGFPLDDSQRFTLRAGLGERADGTWAASTVADFEPRQNGKNDTCNARELAGLVLFGEKLLIHTAHEFATANESFLRMVAIFEAWDDLRKRVARIRYANGEQGIEFLSGQRLKYKARTGGSGRGFAKADLVVYDEAQHLQAEHVAASGPARLANPNSQSWYMGSGGLSTSGNAWRMRRRALSGDGGRLAYVEHTAELVRMVGTKLVSEKPDVLDREAWARANPAYGRRTTDEGMLSLLEEMGADLFARECMCIWDAEPQAGDSVIAAEKWQACADPKSQIVGPVRLAVDVTPDRAWATISAAGNRADGLWHAEVIDHRRGTGWVVGRLVELRNRHQVGGPVVLDGAGPAGSLFTALDGKVDVHNVTTAEAKQACGVFYDSVVDSATLRHLNQPELNAALGDATKRLVGDAWLWDRKGLGVISPLVSVTLAVWAHSQGGTTESDFFTI